MKTILRRERNAPSAPGVAPLTASSALLTALETMRPGDLGALTRLLEIVRGMGVQQAGTPEVREAARQLLAGLGPESTVEHPADHHVLTRLASGHVTAPYYPDFIASSLLRTWDDAAPADVKVQATAMTVGQLADVLLTVPSVRAHAGFESLKPAATGVLDTCRELSFGSRRIQPIPLASLQATLLNEGPEEAPELTFITATLGGQVCFETLDSLFKVALDRVACSDMPLAAAELGWALRLSRLPRRLFSLLRLMNLEEWVSTRPSIALPSAIQSAAYHSMVGNYNEIARCHAHERWEGAEASTFGPTLCLTIHALQTELDGFSRSHIAVLTNYAGPKGTPTPTTVDYIIRQRAVRPPDASTCTADWCPMRGSCPPSAGGRNNSEAA